MVDRTEVVFGPRLDGDGHTPTEPFGTLSLFRPKLQNKLIKHAQRHSHGTNTLQNQFELTLYGLEKSNNSIFVPIQIGV